MGRGVSGIFGGIYPALEIGFSLVGGEKGLKGSINRARVLERKPKHKNYHGRWSGSWITGKILRESNSNVKPSSKDLKKHLGKEKKFFRCQKTPLKLGTNFRGVTFTRLAG